jgi:hypothetical protein
LNKSESNTEEYFRHSGFPIIRVPECKTKTPDFEGDEILVEVKQIVPAENEGLHNDSTYNAVKNNLRDAARKFRAYDPNRIKKHIVAVYSDEIMNDDLYSVWTGKWSPEHRDRIFKSGMLLSNNHKQYIDAIAWFRKVTDKNPAYVWAVSGDLKQYFPEINP